jgi:hypothetical protein
VARVGLRLHWSGMPNAGCLFVPSSSANHLAMGPPTSAVLAGGVMCLVRGTGVADRLGIPDPPARARMGLLVQRVG